MSNNNSNSNISSNIYEGFVQKKSPSGISGFHVWQKRWFVLKKESLQYFKEQKAKAPQGALPFNEINSVTLCAQSKKVGRFDIIVRDRVYAMLAESESLAKVWVQKISQTLENWKKDKEKEEKDLNAKTQSLKITTTKELENAKKAINNKMLPEYTQTLRPEQFGAAMRRSSNGDMPLFTPPTAPVSIFSPNSDFFTDSTQPNNNNTVIVNDIIDNNNHQSSEPGSSSNTMQDTSDANKSAGRRGSMPEISFKVTATDTALQRLVNSRLLKAAKDPSSSKRAVMVLANPANQNVMNENSLKSFFPTNTHTLRYLLTNVVSHRKASLAYIDVASLMDAITSNNTSSDPSITMTSPFPSAISPNVIDVISPTSTLPPNSPEESNIQSNSNNNNNNNINRPLTLTTEREPSLILVDLEEENSPRNNQIPSPNHLKNTGAALTISFFDDPAEQLLIDDTISLPATPRGGQSPRRIPAPPEEPQEPADNDIGEGTLIIPEPREPDENNIPEPQEPHPSDALSFNIHDAPPTPKNNAITPVEPTEPAPKNNNITITAATSSSNKSNNINPSSPPVASSSIISQDPGPNISTGGCPFPNCTDKRVNTSGRRGSISYCDRHKAEIEQMEKGMSVELYGKMQTITTALARIVLKDLVKGNDAPLVSALLEVLEQPDERARGLAVRVLWIVMAKKHQMDEDSTTNNTTTATTGTIEKGRDKSGSIVTGKANLAIETSHINNNNNENNLHDDPLSPTVPWLNDSNLVLDPSIPPTVARKATMSQASETKAIELSSNIFAGYMKAFASGKRFCAPIRDALLSILVYDVETYARQTERIEKMRLKMHLKNSYIWRALFFALQQSPMDLRESTLVEINTLLIDNPFNCDSLRSIGDWQLIVFPLLTDIDTRLMLNLGAEASGIGLATFDASSKNKINQISPLVRSISNAYNYTVNVLTLMNYSYYMKPPSNGLSFAKYLTKTFDLLITFAGFNTKSRAMCRALLVALVRKLESNKSSYPPSLYLESQAWQNLFPLLAIVKRFIFQTEIWNNMANINLINNSLGVDNSILKRRGSAAPPVSSTPNNPSKEDIPPPPSVQLQNNFFVIDEANLNNRITNFKFEELSHWGIHFSSEDSIHLSGVCADGLLNDRIVALLRTLQLHSFDPAANPGLSSGEIDFLNMAKEECLFYTDAKIFFELLGNIRTDTKQIAKIVQTFVNSKSSNERKQIFMQIGQLNAANAKPAAGKKLADKIRDKLGSKKAQYATLSPAKVQEEKKQPIQQQPTQNNNTAINNNNNNRTLELPSQNQNKGIASTTSSLNGNSNSNSQDPPSQSRSAAHLNPSEDTERDNSANLNKENGDNQKPPNLHRRTSSGDDVENQSS